MVTAKGWDEFQGHWRSQKKPGVVRGPDPDMSLTSGGHLVEMETGKLIRTNDMVVASDPPSLADVVEVAERTEPASILDKTVKPKRRLTEKTALAHVGVEVVQQRLLRGQAWANQGVSVCGGQYAGVRGGMDMDQENAALEELLTESGASMRRMEVEAVTSEHEEEEIFLQTRTIA